MMARSLPLLLPRVRSLAVPSLSCSEQRLYLAVSCQERKREGAAIVRGRRERAGIPAFKCKVMRMCFFLLKGECERCSGRGSCESCGVGEVASDRVRSRSCRTSGVSCILERLHVRALSAAEQQQGFQRVGIGNVVAVVLMVRKARRSARWVGVQWSRSACAPSRGGGWMAPMSGSSSLVV